MCEVLAYFFISIFYSPSICPFSPSIYPQVLQQLSQHALLSHCGFEPVQRYTNHSWLSVMSHISFPPLLFSVILLQPFSVNASPPPLFLPLLALTFGVRKLLLTPDHGPSLSSPFAQSWTHCTKR